MQLDKEAESIAVMETTDTLDQLISDEVEHEVYQNQNL